MDQLHETYRQLKGELPHCPSAETIRLHAEGRLEDAEARRVAFHLGDCASCVALMERLNPPDSVELPAELQEEMADEIEQRLEFEMRGPAEDAGEGWFGRILRFRVPALVPVALAAMALALIWWTGGDIRPSVDAPPAIRQLPIITIDQTLTRSGSATGDIPVVEAGAPFVLEVFLDRLDLDPGDDLRFGLTDEEGTPVLNGNTTVLEDYNVRLALTFNQPGTYTVTLADESGAAELERLNIEVRQPG
jgi:hypothetical protein